MLFRIVQCCLPINLRLLFFDGCSVSSLLTQTSAYAGIVAELSADMDEEVAGGCYRHCLRLKIPAHSEVTSCPPVLLMLYQRKQKQKRFG